MSTYGRAIDEHGTIKRHSYEKLKAGDWAIFRTPPEWGHGTPKEYSHLIGMRVMITKDQNYDRYDEFIEFQDPTRPRKLECFRLRLTKIPTFKIKITRKSSSPIKSKE